MQHAVTTPNVSRSIAHYFQEGAAVWGQQITPSIAHIVQLEKELTVGYSRVAPGVFETVFGTVLMPHVVDLSHLRFHADAAALRRAGGLQATDLSAVLTCDVGGSLLLRVWGCIALQQLEPVSSTEFSGRGLTTPVIFSVKFWEIAFLPASPIRDVEADEQIRFLKAKVALSMCSQ